MNTTTKPKAVKSSAPAVDLKAATEHQKWVGTWQTWILALTALIALAAAILSYRTSIKDQEFQSEIFANQTWESYRRLEMEYLQTFKSNAVYGTFVGEQKVLYELMVERLLMAADGVTIKLENDPQWRDSFVYEFRKHKGYLTDPNFLNEFDGAMSSYCTFRRGVRNWIRHSFKSDQDTSKRMTQAEKECLAALQKEGFEE